MTRHGRGLAWDRVLFATCLYAQMRLAWNQVLRIGFCTPRCLAWNQVLRIGFCTPGCLVWTATRLSSVSA
jgi:hypothetical protein